MSLSILLKKTLTTILKVTVTSAALYYVFSKIDLVAFRERLATSNIFLLLIAVVIFACSQIINSFRLLTFFKSMKFNLNREYNLKLYSLGLFYNLFLPGGIGGDGYKIYILKKQFKKPTKKLFWALFLDRLSGLWAIALLSVILCHFIQPKGIFLLLLDIGFLVGCIVYYWVYKKFYPDFFNALKEAHLLAILTQILVAVSAACILTAMGITVKYAHYLTVFLLSSLAAVVPISVGGLGIREAMLLYGAKHLLLDNGNAVSLSLLFYIASALVSLIGAYFVFYDKDFSKYSVSEAEEDAAHENEEKDATLIK